MAYPPAHRLLLRIICTLHDGADALKANVLRASSGRNSTARKSIALISGSRPGSDAASRLTTMALLLALWVSAPMSSHGETLFELPPIDDETAQRLGQRIWENEGRGRNEYLMWWNPGEEFPSFGIGHFIWYPAGTTGRFVESFPKLLDDFAERGVELPAWLTFSRHTGAPWPTRETFFAARETTEFRALHTLLAATVDTQARFIVSQLAPGINRVVEAAPPEDRQAVRDRAAVLAQSAAGLYALVDYLNFKGDGTRESERYAGYGWGLLQVLSHHPSWQAPRSPTEAFSHAALAVLTRRVEHAPTERNEARWLPGWTRRVRTYSE